jgi:hypothetical protein
MLPAITTFRPAVDGFGEEVVVRLPAAHGVGVQQPGVGQHVVTGTPVERIAQHGGPTQHSGMTIEPLVSEPGGSRQHGTTSPLAYGHAIRGARAAVAGPAIPTAQTAVATRKGASGAIHRRIACVRNREAIRPRLTRFHK